MRFSTLFTLFLALLVAPSFVLASLRHSTLNSRATSDTCAYLNLKFLGLVNLNLCLCLGSLSTFVTSNPLLATVVALFGSSSVTTSLANLISLNGKTCSYPANSIPMCSTTDVCAFTCTTGHIKCNGQCIVSSTGLCPSGVGQVARKRGLWGMCKKGEVACGIMGRGGREWECINTTTDLESCGGCTISLVPQQDPPAGQDCTTIPNVDSVGCVDGACQVQSCTAGYEPSQDGRSCEHSDL